jgi:RHS repeat-associated protein
LPTGSKTLILGTSDWLKNVTFYDKYSRAIQTKSNNHLHSTVDNISTVVYNNEKVRVTKSDHNAGGSNQVTVISEPKYDVTGRTQKVYHKINSNSRVLATQYEYNALGQVVDKKLHDTGGSFLQSVDYRYTILGQLESINNSTLTSDSKNDETDDYFGMEILYNRGESGFNSGDTVYHDGNISAIKWKQFAAGSGAAGQRSYKYKYDKSGKLRTSTFAAYGTDWTKEPNTLDETVSYDHNGNIYKLHRKRNDRGLTGTDVTASSQEFDNLTYTYASGKGNLLTKVEEGVSGSTGDAGFKNGSTATTEYDYDAIGNLIYDKNKGIDSIKYNELGKVKRMKYSDGRVVTYLYDAAGNKLTMKTYASGGLLQTTTDYVNGFVYENNALSYFGSPEGRVVKNGGNFEYQYAIADHQGNTRVVFTSAVSTPTAVGADMEGSSNSDFEHYTNRVNWSLMDHTESGGSNYSQKLTGASGQQVGVAKSYRVYPGDKVKIKAFAKYQGSSGTSNLTGFAAALLSAFGLSAPGSGEFGTPSAAVNAWGSLIAAGDGHETTGDPKAFVNILVFDKNYNYLDMGWDQIDDGEQIGGMVKADFDSLTQEYTAKEEGYIYVYVSNENPTLVDVYFDDVVVTYTKSNLIQGAEYYPYGMQTANSWTRENSTANQHLYNGGSELNASSGLYETFFRGYDATLGRFVQVDPLATEVHVLSPYNYANGNPATFNDPNGDKVCADCAEEAARWNMMNQWVASLDTRGFNWESWRQDFLEYSQRMGMGGGGGITIGNMTVDFGKLPDNFNGTFHFEKGKVVWGFFAMSSDEGGRGQSVERMARDQLGRLEASSKIVPVLDARVRIKEVRYINNDLKDAYRKVGMYVRLEYIPDEYENFSSYNMIVVATTINRGKKTQRILSSMDNREGPPYFFEPSKAYPSFTEFNYEFIRTMDMNDRLVYRIEVQVFGFDEGHTQSLALISWGFSYSKGAVVYLDPTIKMY